MSSPSLSSTASSLTPVPKIQPPTPIPQVDLTALAKTTRKTLERLVPFSHMRPSSPETSPKLTKIINKINHYISLIDSSMLCEQLGYQLANNCMILCDPELCAGLSTPAGNVRVTTRGPGGAWTLVGVNRQPGAADAAACVFGREDARELARKGYEIASKVNEEFGNIAQDMYKIAASTKDDMLLVLVPPDPTHPTTLKIQLKDVGTNLVANLSLLSEFSKAVSEVANWWSSVKDDLALEEPALLLALTSSQCGDNEQGGRENFAWWSQMKDDFQDYGDEINAVHLRFPALLPSSSAAWQSVVSARSQAPSPLGLSNNPQNKPGVDPSGSKGRTRLGSFRLRWKRMDKEKREKETKSIKTLVKRKGSKEKDQREGIEDDKKTKEVKSETRDMTVETDDENNTKQEFSSTEKRDSRKTMTMKRSFILSCIF